MIARIALSALYSGRLRVSRRSATPRSTIRRSSRWLDLADVARCWARAGAAFDHSSQNITGATARWLGRGFALASIAGALLMGTASAGRPTPSRALSLLAALGSLVALAPVLSPQYLLSIAPLSALVAPRYHCSRPARTGRDRASRAELRSAFDDLPRFDARRRRARRRAERRACLFRDHALAQAYRRAIRKVTRTASASRS